MRKMLKTDRSTAELTADIQDAIALLISQEPELRSTDLAERAMAETEPDTVAELGQRLVLRLALHLARMERAKLRPRQQFLLPGFEHIPQRIAIGDKERVRLETATYTQVREYVRRLSNLHRDRAQQDPKLMEGRALLEKMAKYNRIEPGITVKEVMGRER